MKRPCTCDLATCRLCTLYYHDPAYRALWSEEGPPTKAPARLPIKRPLVCVFLRETLVRHACNCRRDDVRLCQKEHGKVTQNGFCEICPDYKAEER